MSTETFFLQNEPWETIVLPAPGRGEGRFGLRPCKAALVLRT